MSRKRRRKKRASGGPPGSAKGHSAIPAHPPGLPDAAAVTAAAAGPGEAEDAGPGEAEDAGSGEPAEPAVEAGPGERADSADDIADAEPADDIADAEPADDIADAESVDGITNGEPAQPRDVAVDAAVESSLAPDAQNAGDAVPRAAVDSSLAPDAQNAGDAVHRAAVEASSDALAEPIDQLEPIDRLEPIDASEPLPDPLRAAEAVEGDADDDDEVLVDPLAGLMARAEAASAEAGDEDVVVPLASLMARVEPARTDEVEGREAEPGAESAREARDQERADAAARARLEPTPDDDDDFDPIAAIIAREPDPAEPEPEPAFAVEAEGEPGVIGLPGARAAALPDETPVPPRAFLKGAVFGLVVLVPLTALAVYVLARFGVGDPEASYYTVIAFVAVFAGLPAMVTAGGVGRAAASALVRPGRHSGPAAAFRVAALQTAIAEIGLILLSVVPLGEVPVDGKPWALIAVAGLAAGGAGGFALGLWVRYGSQEP